MIGQESFKAKGKTNDRPRSRVQLRTASAHMPRRPRSCLHVPLPRMPAPDGSTFGVQAWFPREQVRLVRGADKRYARQADSGRVVTFHFCPECGGTVFWEAEQRPTLIAVAIGMFADPDFEGPSLSVWERRQHPWTVAIGNQQIERSD
jgi:hypothetical protein